MQKGGYMAKVTLAAARVAAGYSQEELANILGVSRVLVTNLETGKTKLKPFYLYAICHVTGFSESDILLPEESTKR